MGTIGITAVTSKAAAMSYLHMIETALKWDGKHPEILIQSSPVDLCLKAIQQAVQKKPEQLIELLLGSILKLRNAGASIAIIPNNSSHLVIDELQKRSPIECISIIEPVVKKCKSEKFSNTCIIGPTAVIDSKMYEMPLMHQGIQVISPDKAAQQFLQEVIFDASKKGSIPDEHKDKVKDIFQELRSSKSFDSVIVSCSELTDIIDADFAQLPIINPFQLQAEAALKYEA